MFYSASDDRKRQAARSHLACESPEGTEIVVL